MEEYKAKGTKIVKTERKWKKSKDTMVHDFLVLERLSFGGEYEECFWDSKQGMEV